MGRKRSAPGPKQRTCPFHNGSHNLYRSPETTGTAVGGASSPPPRTRSLSSGVSWLDDGGLGFPTIHCLTCNQGQGTTCFRQSCKVKTSYYVQSPRHGAQQKLDAQSVGAVMAIMIKTFPRGPRYTECLCLFFFFNRHSV